jgi:hypothetical protein
VKREVAGILAEAIQAFNGKQVMADRVIQSANLSAGVREVASCGVVTTWWRDRPPFHRDQSLAGLIDRRLELRSSHESIP